MIRTTDNILAIIIWVGVCLAVGFIAGRFSPGTWYQNLIKPSWTPPGGVFPVVWTILYVMMGMSGWIIWREIGLAAAVIPIIFFALQLALNALWPYIFFFLHRPGLAFAEIIVLWAVVLVTLILFWMKRPLAGALLLPYLVWLTFAAALNFSIWRMNRI